MTPRIEPVVPERDLDDIAEIARASFSNPWTRDMFARELEQQLLSRSYVLRAADDRVAAFCTCWLVVDELHINTMAVRPEFRRQGLGRRLLEHVLADAARQGATRATLEVRRSNAAAIALYEAFGFAVEASRKDYYPNPPEDALILSRAL
ncbi:MAG TPA: ribosomal protein S18-alanine N-acetyltransferase [Vicinamibacterales bacterium]|nr:ribosomal protein S18-alanine N-acetyltransferase [Vicinamibacterales bacterium]